MEAEHLQHVARTRIANGQLPTGRPTRFFGGPGNGESCNLCDERIGLASVSIEVEQASDVSLNFHANCYRAYVQASASSA